MMRKPINALLCVAIIAGVSLNAAARGFGGGSGFGGHQVTGPSLSSQAFENSNGRFAADRDTGLSRAEDRMSAEGLKHQKGIAAQATRHHRAPIRSEQGGRETPR